MAMTVSCPSCNTTLRLGEENQGKKMRCPSCQQVFKAPLLSEDANRDEDADRAPDPPPRSRRLDVDDDRPRRDEQSYSPRRDEDDRPRRDRRDDDRDDRPRRSRRDEDDEDRPRRRRRDYDDRPRRSESPGGSANVLAILSCCLFCIPIIGFILGIIAYNQANSALNYDLSGSERRSLESTKSMALVGMCLAGGMVVLGCLIRVAGAGAGAMR